MQKTYMEKVGFLPRNSSLP